jgi:hypothetical protein
MTFLEFRNPPGGSWVNKRPQADVIHLQRQETWASFLGDSPHVFERSLSHANQVSALLLTHLFLASSLAHPTLPQNPVRVRTLRQ